MAPDAGHAVSGDGPGLRSVHDLERRTREGVALCDVPGPGHPLYMAARVSVVGVAEVADAGAEELPEGLDRRVPGRAVASGGGVHVAVLASEAGKCFTNELAGVVGVDLVGRSVPEQDPVADGVRDSFGFAAVEADELDPERVEVDEAQDLPWSVTVAPPTVEVHAPAASGLLVLLRAEHAVHVVALGLRHFA